jgi:hypothetical protein
MTTVALYSFEDRMSAHRYKVGLIGRARHIAYTNAYTSRRPMKLIKLAQASPPSLPISRSTTLSALPKTMGST